MANILKQINTRSGRNLFDLLERSSNPNKTYLIELSEKLNGLPFGSAIDLGDENLNNINLNLAVRKANPDQRLNSTETRKKYSLSHLGSGDRFKDYKVIFDDCNSPAKLESEKCEDIVEALEGIQEDDNLVVNDAFIKPYGYSGNKSVAEQAWDDNNKYNLENELSRLQNAIDLVNAQNDEGIMKAAKETGRTVEQLKNAWLGHDVQKKQKDLEDELLRRYNYVAMDPLMYTDSENPYEKYYARAFFSGANVDWRNVKNRSEFIGDRHKQWIFDTPILDQDVIDGYSTYSNNDKRVSQDLVKKELWGSK